MTITARTTGDLYGYTVVEEAEYGTKNTSGTSEYAGTLISLDTTGGREYEEDLAEGSFKRDSAVGISISAGYKATYKLHTSSDWDECIKRVVGSTDGIGTLRDIPSYTTSIRVASDEYLSWTGCKVDTLTLKSSAIGALIEASATVSAQYMATPSSSLNFTDASGTAYTMTSAVKPDTVPLHDNTSWYWSDDLGTTWTSCDNKTWELSISRGLQAEAGSVGGAPLAAGIGAVPTKCDVGLKVTTLSVSKDWDTLKATEQTDLQFKKVMDGKTVTLTGCYLLPDSWPGRIQGVYDETVSVQVGDITVA